MGCEYEYRHFPLDVMDTTPKRYDLDDNTEWGSISTVRRQRNSSRRPSLRTTLKLPQIRRP